MTTLLVKNDIMNIDTEVKRGITVLWETLQCPICLELLTQPVSTKCDHQFCKFCMLKLLDNTKRSTANCPVCKEKITKRSLRESQSFQRLVTGVQDMIQAYEYDTATNYFTGLAQEIKRSHVIYDKQVDKPTDKLEGVENTLQSSHSSTKAALQGFAKVMGFDDSNPLMTEGEIQEGGLTDSVQTSQYMESKKATVKTSRLVSRRKSRKDQVVPAVLENQTVTQSAGQKTDPELEHISEKKKKESVEKVAEWLLKVPAEESLVLDEPTEVARISDDSNRSASTPDIKTFNNKKQVTKTLEDEVFGTTYKRERKSNSNAHSSGIQPKATSVTLADVRKSTEENCGDVEMSTTNIHDEDLDNSSENDENDKIDFYSLEIIHLKRKPIKRLRSALQQVDSDLQTKAKMECIGPKKADKPRGSSERGKSTRSARTVKPLILVGVQNEDDIAKSKLPPEAVQVHIENYPSSEDQESAVASCIRRSRRLLLSSQNAQQQTPLKAATGQGAKTLGKKVKDNRTSPLLDQNNCKSNGCVYEKDICAIENMELSHLENVVTGVTLTESKACADPDPPPIPSSATDNGVAQEEAVKCLIASTLAEKEENSNDSKMDSDQLFKRSKPTKRKPFLTTRQGAKSLKKNVKDNGTLVQSDTKTPRSNGYVYDKNICAIENMEISNLENLVTGVPLTESKAFADTDLPLIPSSATVDGVTVEGRVHRSIPSTTAEKENCNDSEMDTEQLFKSFKPTKRKSFRLTRSNRKKSQSGDEKPMLSPKKSNPTESDQQCAKEQTLPMSDLTEPSPCSDLIPPTNFPLRKINSEVVAASVLLRSTVSSALSPNKVAMRETESPLMSFVPQIVDSGLCFHERERQVIPESTLETSTRESQKNTTESPTKAGNSSVTAYQHLLETDCSMTPDGLDIPPGQPRHGTQTSPLSYSRSKPRRKMRRRARRLQYSSETQSSFSEQLQTFEIFQKDTPPTQDRCADKANGHEANADADQQEANAETNDQEANDVPGWSSSPDYVASSQASVDLFDPPDEHDVPVTGASISAESSQFATELLVTQQKMEMQKELVRLEKLMALVTEVLQEKEANPSVCPVVRKGGECDLDVNHNPECKTLAEVMEEPERRPQNGEQLAQTAKEMSTTPSAHAEAGEKSVAESNSTSSDKENKTPESDGNRAKMVLVSSGLAPAEQITVKRFAKRLCARVVSQVTAEVTHIVMRTDDQLVCERTLKYFLGIASRKWVVSFNWITECFKQKKLLDESLYEVRGDVVNGSNHLGPMRARTTNDDNLLMRDYEICFQGPFPDMTTEEMEWMVQLCGATVAKDPLELQMKRKSNQLVIVQTASAPCTYSGLLKQVPVVTRGWLLDSVGTYTLQGYSNYLA
ncbi:breast cancer type 1 susceptibility protein homolog isoform X2 [Corythoichthys intestinalis]|uniref:breast cancer type 1 susceptibility protein homolog isoform X2 n=1 Tax=Corythoichthys intestinalis TaxID=161448 RepID=UPI0025A63006|nr:breast cancer type 1 susceptibility protein homolog isoform X2 [Corythoichthys intestinalis]